MTAKLRTSSQSRSAGRIELFFKGPAELKERVRFLRSNGIASFNLVNKDKKDTMEKSVNSIREVYPEANISAHYSLKHNKVPRKGIEAHCGLLLKNLKRSKADEILLVSGGGDKKAWNTIEALKSVQRATNSALTAETTSFPKLAVAYNPYFPSREDQEVEDLRLKEKLATGCVSKIYLQFGTDMDCLKRGLDFIRNNAGAEVAIAGSLFLPTKKLIAQQKFRPWNGVFLSSNFLNGPEEATAIILEMMKVYNANNVEMLWEAPGIRTDNDMGIVRELFNDAGLSCVFEDCDENKNGNANSKGASIKRTPTCETLLSPEVDIPIQNLHFVSQGRAIAFTIPLDEDELRLQEAEKVFAALQLLDDGANSNEGDSSNNDWLLQSLEDFEPEPYFGVNGNDSLESLGSDIFDLAAFQDKIELCENDIGIEGIIGERNRLSEKEGAEKDNPINHTSNITIPNTVLEVDTLPDIDIDFSDDPFLISSSDFHTIFDDQDRSNIEKENIEENDVKKTINDEGNGKSSDIITNPIDLEEQNHSLTETKEEIELFQHPIDEEFPLDIDLETEELYKELANMSLAENNTNVNIVPETNNNETQAEDRNPDITNQDNSTGNKNTMKSNSTGRKKAAMDLLMGPGSTPPEGLPFDQMCQPCTPNDLDAMITGNTGLFATDLINTMENMLPLIAEDQANDAATTQPSLPDAATAQSLLEAVILNQETPSSNPQSQSLPDAATTQPSLPGKNKATMDLLMEPRATDVPLDQMCQPCSPNDFNVMASENPDFGAGVMRSMDKILPQIAEDRPLDAVAEVETDQRSREQKIQDLRELYRASASVKKDDLEPLDYSSDPLQTPNSNSEQLAQQLLYHQQQAEQLAQQLQEQQQKEEQEQLAQQLQHQQQQQEYEVFRKNANHWAKAFGVNIEEVSDKKNGEPKTTSSRKNTSKCGLGHKETIFGVTFSECGRYAATASQDATVGIWDVKTNRLLSSLKGHNKNYECLRVDWASRIWAEDVLDRSTRFANLIASSGADGIVKLWACHDKNGLKKEYLREIDNNWTCIYDLDHANFQNVSGEEKKDDNPDSKDNKPQVYCLQFIDHWNVFAKDLGEQVCSRHSQREDQKRPATKDDNNDKNSFLMTSSDEFVHFWEVECHAFDKQMKLDDHKIRILQDQMKIKEVMSLHFGLLDDYGYGVTACSVTGKGMKLPPPPSKRKQEKDEKIFFGGERNPENTIFVFDAAYCPGNGLLGVALADGSLRLVNGRGFCISVIQLPGSQSHLTSFSWDTSGSRLATCVGTGHLITWSLDAKSFQGGNHNAVATCTAIFEGGHQKGRPLFGSRYCGEDENLLLSWGVDGKICLWYAQATGNIYDPIVILRDDGKYPIYDVDVSASEQNVVVGGGSDGGFIGVPFYFYDIPPQEGEKGVVGQAENQIQSKK